MPLRADEHPGGSMSCYMGIFKRDFECLCVRVWQIHRGDMQREDLNNTKENAQKTFFVLACIVIWLGQSVVFYCYVLPICIRTFLSVPNLARVHVLVEHVCGFFSPSNCVPATVPICVCSQWNQ